MSDSEHPASTSNENGGNNNHISSPHITLSIGDSTKTALWVIIAAVVILFLTVHTANGARDTAVSASKKADLAAYWAEQMAIECSQVGLKLSPDPFKAK